MYTPHVEVGGTSFDSSCALYHHSSKAALNTAMKGLATTLGVNGVGVLFMHPRGSARAWAGLRVV
jgi:hypothetical protein